MLMRTDPFRDLDRLAGQLLDRPSGPAPMPLDAYRDGDQFVVELDLPGIDPDSIDLTVERNVLTIAGNRRRRTDGREMTIAERPHGAFRRQLFLGDTLDTSAIDATYVDGVVTLRLPIAERAKPRSIPLARGTAGPSSIEASATEPATEHAREGELVGSSA
ncbi:MAG: Hsp20/alpha crystallin family protein [Aquihabitans sp.]